MQKVVIIIMNKYYYKWEHILLLSDYYVSNVFIITMDWLSHDFKYEVIFWIFAFQVLTPNLFTTIRGLKPNADYEAMVIAILHERTFSDLSNSVKFRTKLSPGSQPCQNIDLQKRINEYILKNKTIS